MSVSFQGDGLYFNLEGVPGLRSQPINEVAHTKKKQAVIDKP
jgi:hypothetical protein